MTIEDRRGATIWYTPNGGEMSIDIIGDSFVLRYHTEYDYSEETYGSMSCALARAAIVVECLRFDDPDAAGTEDEFTLQWCNFCDNYIS